MIISTTGNIDNREIESYLGIVSGTDIYLVGGLLGGGLMNQENLYSQALSNAISKMEDKARKLGANAIVGVSTNIASPGNLNNIIVIATGTAVIIKNGKTVQDANLSKKTCEWLREDSFEKQFKYDDYDQAIRDIEESFIDKSYDQTIKDIEEPLVHEDHDATIQEISDNDYIDLACPKCNETLSFLLCEIGEAAACPYCGTEFKIK